MKRILITGANNHFGMVAQQLESYAITPFGLTTDYDALVRGCKEQDAILHFAWNPETENWKSETIDATNMHMAANMYRAAYMAGVPRVIVESSVHADNFLGWTGPGLMRTDRVPTPPNPYGASRVFVETLGRYYAQKGLEVICVRFAGIHSENQPPPLFQDLDRRRWLSHGDFLSLLKAAIDVPRVPENYALFYGVSNHPRRIHDYANPIGWEPKENADDLQFRGKHRIAESLVHVKPKPVEET